jgi:hypothetical protein
MLEAFTAATFSPHLHDRFRLEADRPLELELVEVTESAPVAGWPRAPFSILFRGPAGTVLAGRSHRDCDGAGAGASVG